MKAALLALVALVLTPSLALADGFIVVRDHPMPHRPIPYAFAPLEVKHHHVTVRIEDQVATTEVDQVFYNPNPTVLEGTYIFPIPKGAQIDSFLMDVNGRMTQAELLDADKARKIYEDIVRRMKDPALLEYAGQAMFKVRIYPIEARGDKRVKLKYTEILKKDGALTEYRYPLNTERFSAAPIGSVSVKVELATKQRLQTVYSPSHTVDVNRRGANEAVVGWETSRARPDTDFQLLYGTDDKSDIGISLMAHREPGDKEGTFLLLLSPSAQAGASQVVDKDVVFVLDNSGSMAEGDKLTQAKKALTFCVANLNAGDRFEVVRFSTEAESVFGKLVEATADNRAKAREFVEALTPMGGTAIEEALTTALGPVKSQAQVGRPYVVVFLTDGRPTIGETDEEAILKSVITPFGNAPVRIFSFGIGTDINTHLLDKLTERTRAVSQYVLPDEDIELKVSSFYSKINDPVMANLEVAFSNVRVTRLEPKVLPDLFKGDQLVVLGRYSGSGDTAITLEGVVNGKGVRLVYEGKLPEKDITHPFIPRLWATRRVGWLLDEIRLRGESKELRDEVTDLARRYGIVTPYTAYLIVEDEDRRNVPLRARAMAPLGGDRAMREEYKGAYDAMKKSKDGGAGVRAAQANQALRSAPAAAAAQEKASDFAAQSYGALGAGGAATGVGAGGGEAAGRMAHSLEQQKPRYVGGRAFYQNGAQWVDANVQSNAGAKNVQVKFGSDAYFALLDKHPEAAPWLALGRNVQVVLGSVIYDITE
ncbi:MAG: hypothetical protein AMXMBFR64_23220 [Myxococcales bacterium]